MHFTIVLSGDESHDLSFGLVFIPCPCWVRGEDMLLNFNPSTPALEPGFVRRLFDHVVGLRDEVARAGGRCTVVVHAGGHGGPRELALIAEELRNESLLVEIVDRSRRGGSVVAS